MTKGQDRGLVSRVDRSNRSMGRGEMKNDKELQRDVLEELQGELSVDAAEIGVTARDSVVTLVGTVPSYAEKVRAEDAAKRVHGVKAVANDIEVRLRAEDRWTDTDIAQAAIQALRWSTTVPDERIKLVVSKAWVTLDGVVDWQYQRTAAEDAVRHLAGVTGVTNDIRVKSKGSGTEIQSQIEADVRRKAGLDAQRIRVEAHDGTVTLKGDVHSCAERQEAERTAWAAPEVTRVENLITVTPWRT